MNSRGKKVDHGDFSDSTGYWKTLIDRPMYRNDGTYRDRQAVNMSNFQKGMLTSEWTETHWGEYKIKSRARRERSRRQISLLLNGSILSRTKMAKKKASNLRTSPKAQEESQPHSAMQRGLNSTQTKLSSTAVAGMLDGVNLSIIPENVKPILFALDKIYRSIEDGRHYVKGLRPITGSNLMGELVSLFLPQAIKSSISSLERNLTGKGRYKWLLEMEQRCPERTATFSIRD